MPRQPQAQKMRRTSPERSPPPAGSATAAPAPTPAPAAARSSSNRTAARTPVAPLHKRRNHARRSAHRHQHRQQPAPAPMSACAASPRNSPPAADSHPTAAPGRRTPPARYRIGAVSGSSPTTAAATISAGNSATIAEYAADCAMFRQSWSSARYIARCNKHRYAQRAMHTARLPRCAHPR